MVTVLVTSRHVVWLMGVSVSKQSVASSLHQYCGLRWS